MLFLLKSSISPDPLADGSLYGLVPAAFVWTSLAGDFGDEFILLALLVEGKSLRLICDVAGGDD